MPISVGFSAWDVSAGFWGIRGSSWVAEATYRRQECHVASEVAMPYIKVRKQSDGSTSYTAIVRLRSGKTIVHQEAKTFAHRSAAVSSAKHREVAPEDPDAL